MHLSIYKSIFSVISVDRIYIFGYYGLNSLNACKKGNKKPEGI